MASNKGKAKNQNPTTSDGSLKQPEIKNTQATEQNPPAEQNNQTTPPVEQTTSAPPAPATVSVPAPQKPVKFESRYAKHTLNFDGVPKIEFTPVSSRDANQGGVFETINPRQINALRECDDFKRGVIKEVK